MNITIINYSFLFYFIAFVFSIIHFLINKKKTEVIFKIIFFLGILLNLISILVRWIESGRPPFSNLYESLIFTVFCFALTYLIFTYFYKKNFLHLIFSLLTLLLIAYSTLYTETAIKPLMPALKSNWLTIHVSSYMLSYAVIGISFVISCIVIFQSITKSGEFSDDSNKEYKLSDFNYKLISFAFPLLTLGLITGAVWAKRAWGDYWSWDIKETWALICWFYYVNYLHLPYSLPKIIKNYNSKKRKIIESIVLIFGFFLIIFTYLGLQYLPTAEKSLHLYK